MPDSAARQRTGRKLLRSSLVVGCMTMISRVAGLVRDVVLASMLGAAANADAFYIAFRVPQFLRRLFAEGAFSQAFVPVLSEYRATRSVAEVKALVDAVSGVLGAALLSVTALTSSPRPSWRWCSRLSGIVNPEPRSVNGGVPIFKVPGPALWRFHDRRAPVRPGESSGAEADAEGGGRSAGYP